MEKTGDPLIFAPSVVGMFRYLNLKKTHVLLKKNLFPDGIFSHGKENTVMFSRHI